MDTIPDNYDVEVWNSLPQDIKDELKRVAPAKSTAASSSCKAGTQSFLSFGAKVTSNGLKRDDSFPPSYKSIDGRNSDSCGTDVIIPECGCRQKMKLSRVSRAGKNQGMTYLRAHDC
jgi:hypothetical protein